MSPFGFSFTGTAFLVALFVPNIVWALIGRPRDYDPGGENRILRALERVGQVLTVAAAVVFTSTNLQPWSAWSLWLVMAVILMLAYEAGWVRYFRGRRTVRNLYRSMLGVPLPLATLPVAAFMLLGIYGRLLPLLGATILLGIGHIGIHLQHYRAVTAADAPGRREDADA